MKSSNVTPHIFTPIGGMNQDDSMITPTPNMAGKNAFELGDYKYALNMRIGSSRKDNFGDGEIIKDTVIKDTYWARAIVNTNSSFASGLTGWSQQAVSGSGSWVLSGADVVNTNALSNILYQSITPTGKRMGFWIKIKLKENENATCNLIFLNGSTILSSKHIFNGDGDNFFVADIHEKYVNVEIPEGCNRVGIQMIQNGGVGNGQATIQGFKFFDYVASSRPSGTEIVKGRYEDKENNLLYYAVYNSAGNHSIRFYDPTTGYNYTILQWSGLNYTATDFQGMAMIDNYLGMTDSAKLTSPRLMDVWSIADLYLILGSTEFREYHISFHKWAPVQPPIIKSYWDGSVDNIEKFYGKSLQFSYRYVYQGNLKSRYSPVSNCAQNLTQGNFLSGIQLTAIDISIPGFSLDTPGAATQYNYFGNDNVKFYSVVEKIELVFRESANDPWKILKRYDVKANTNTSFRYEGDSNSTPVSEDDFNQLYDVVPFKAGAIEAIDNRFVFSDTLEEKEPASQVQVTDVEVNSWTLPDATLYWNRGSVTAGANAAFFAGLSSENADELGFRNIISRLTFKGRGLYKLGIQWIAENGWRSAVYTNDSWIYEIPEESGSIDKIYSLSFKFPPTFQPPEWAVAYQIVRTNCLNIDYFMFGPCNEIRGLVDDNSTAVADELVQSAQEIRDRNRQHFEDAREVAGKDFKSYKNVLKNKNYYKSFALDVRKTAAAASLSDSSRLYINITNWYNSSKKSAGTDNNPLNNLFYNYREGEQAKLGDRVRFIASTNATPTDDQKVVYDLPILEFTGRGIVVEKPDGILWLPGNSAQTDAKDMMIEVYSPYQANQQDYLYHEVGEWYPVLYPGTSQREMAKRDWTYTTNDAITCTTYGDFKAFINMPFCFGDCHAIDKTYYYDYQALTGNQVVAKTCSMVPDPDRTFDFWEYAIGRSYPAYTDFPVVKFIPTMVRFGGQIIEESMVNQINRFRPEDYKIYPSEYGRIRALVNTANAQVESVGAILLAIGERETFSIYVNRNTLEDLSGSTSIALSDKVLGSYNTLLGSHGTLNPESVSIHRGRVYFWDAMDGSWVRYGRDGLTPISGYKMRNWFRELGQLLITKYQATAPHVVSGFDPFNDELLTYINHADLPATFRDYANYKGSVFSEEDKRWKGCHNYDVDMFGTLNTQLICFRNGSLYLTEQGPAYSTFFGSKKDVYIEPVAVSMKDMSSWQNVAVISTDNWSVERFLSEYRGQRSKRTSVLALDQMQYEEDKYVAAVKGDTNSPAGNAIEGDKMKSRALRVLLKLDPSVVTESLLHYVQVDSIDSPRNP